MALFPGARVVFTGDQAIRRHLEIPQFAHGLVHAMHDDGTCGVRFDTRTEDCNVSAKDLTLENLELAALLPDRETRVGLLCFRGFGIYERFQKRRQAAKPTVMRLTGVRMDGGELEIEVMSDTLADQAVMQFAAILQRSPLDFQLLNGDVPLESSTKLVHQGVKDGSLLTILNTRRHVGPDDVQPVDSDGMLLLPTPPADVNLWQHYLYLVPPDARLHGGAFGETTCRCMDCRDGTLYAVRVIHTVRCADGMNQELSVLQCLRANPHARIIEVFGRGEKGPVVAQVLEFIGGGTLRSRMGVLGRGQPRTDYVPPPQSLYWIRQVLEGLVHLHLTLQILLLDLKPDNILLNSTDDVKLSDFQSSRCCNSDGEWVREDACFSSFTFPLDGSPGYCAPEVIQDGLYTYSADLYSFGAMIWMLLTGGAPQFDGPPFSGGSASRMSWDYKLLHACIKSPEAHNVRPLPSPEAEDLVLGLTKRLPAQRPKHHDIFAHALLLAP